MLPTLPHRACGRTVTPSLLSRNTTLSAATLRRRAWSPGGPSTYPRPTWRRQRMARKRSHARALLDASAVIAKPKPLLDELAELYKDAFDPRVARGTDRPAPDQRLPTLTLTRGNRRAAVRRIPKTTPSVREQILADFATLRVPVSAEQLDEVLKKAAGRTWTSPACRSGGNCAERCASNASSAPPSFARRSLEHLRLSFICGNRLRQLA